MKEYCRKTGKTFVQSYTTRPRRKDDAQELPDHIFIDENQIEPLKNEIIAYTEIGDYKYFSTMSQVMSSDFYIIDPIGYHSLVAMAKQYKLDLELIPVYIVCNKQTMADRAYNRGQDMNHWYKRYYDENQQFSSFEHLIAQNPTRFFTIDNNQFFARALNELERIVNFEMVN